MTLNINSINPDQLTEVLDICYKVKHAALILGAPGIGKSTIIKQWCEHNQFNLVTRTLGNLQPGDLSIPDINGDTLTWKIADWLVNIDKEKPTIFFFDELMSADEAVRTQIYQLVLDRRLGGYILPDNAYVVAAGNRVEDDLSVHQIGKALADRFNIIHLEPSVEKWISWGVKNNIHPCVLSFITAHPNYLILEDNDEYLIQPSPRSWNRVSEILQEVPDIEDVNNFIQGYIGESITTAFILYFREALNLPSLKEMLMMNSVQRADLDLKISHIWTLVFSFEKTVSSATELLEATKILFELVDFCSYKYPEELKISIVDQMFSRFLERGFDISEIQNKEFFIKEFYERVKNIPSLESIV